MSEAQLSTMGRTTPKPKHPLTARSTQNDVRTGLDGLSLAALGAGYVVTESLQGYNDSVNVKT